MAASASYRLCSSCALAVDGDAAGASTGCGGVRQAKRRARVAWSPLARSLCERGAVIQGCRQTDSVSCSSGCRFIGRFFRACCASLRGGKSERDGTAWHMDMPPSACSISMPACSISMPPLACSIRMPACSISLLLSGNAASQRSTDHQQSTGGRWTLQPSALPKAPKF